MQIALGVEAEPECVRQLGTASGQVGARVLCAGDTKPGVYTRVAAYRQWIEDVPSAPP